MLHVQHACTHTLSLTHTHTDITQNTQMSAAAAAAPARWRRWRRRCSLQGQSGELGCCLEDRREESRSREGCSVLSPSISTSSSLTSNVYNMRVEAVRRGLVISGWLVVLGGETEGGGGGGGGARLGGFSPPPHHLLAADLCAGSDRWPPKSSAQSLWSARRLKDLQSVVMEIN